jgi:diguanylate cyclase (GGDEF)-like protein
VRPLFRLSDAERAALVDASRRLRPVSRTAIGLVVLATLICTPSFGWAPLVPMAIAAAVFTILQSRLDRYRRPEYALAWSWLVAQGMVVAVIVVASGPRELLFALFALPMMMAAVVWPTRLVVAGTALSTGTLIAVAFATEAEMVLSNPPVLTHQVALLVSTALIASISRDAEVASRRSAVVDQLTGTLNRAALEARSSELEHQSAATGSSVAVLVADIDGFKGVNDEHGHATGDAVLQEAAYRIRKLLPAFAGVYRFGGDEFVVLLHDVSSEEALATAERLRAAVSAEPMAGLAVTMSLGAAASQPGERFSYDRVFAAADQALYRAKSAGRDGALLASHADSEVAPLRRATRHERRAPTAGYGLPAGGSGPHPAPLEPRAQSETGTWLVDPIERHHLLELTRRLFHANHVPYAVAFAAVIVLGPFYGWWPLLPVVLGAIVYRSVERRLNRFQRPEFALGAAWLVAQVANAGAYFTITVPDAVIGSPLFALPLLIIMVVGSSAVFPPRGVFIGTAFTAALMVGTAVFLERGTLHEPRELAVSLSLLAAIGLIGCAVGQSTVRHRGAAVTDRLTGLLNRRALEARAAELAHQTEATGEPVALVLADLDNFKQVNDRHGHAAGDHALEDVAVRLRSHLRAFEGVYRFGGEEFAIVLTGATAADAVSTAERLRAAVAGEAVAGMPMTMSFGVAASEPGEPFDFESVFEQADRALYAAKYAGRDRVRAAGGSVAPLVPSGAAAA